MCKLICALGGGQKDRRRVKVRKGEEKEKSEKRSKITKSILTYNRIHISLEYYPNLSPYIQHITPIFPQNKKMLNPIFGAPTLFLLFFLTINNANALINPQVRILIYW